MPSVYEHLFQNDSEPSLEPSCLNSTLLAVTAGGVTSYVNAEHIDVLKVQCMIVNSDVHQLLTVANKHNDG